MLRKKAVNNTLLALAVFVVLTIAYFLSFSSSFGVFENALANDKSIPDFSFIESCPNCVYRGDLFRFGVLVIDSEEDNTEQAKPLNRYVKTLTDPSGAKVYEVSGYGERYRTAVTAENAGDYVLKKTGTYTVWYQMFDADGNRCVLSRTVTVSARNTVNTQLFNERFTVSQEYAGINVGDRFVFNGLEISERFDGMESVRYIKQLKDENGDVLYCTDGTGESYRLAQSSDDLNGYVIENAGKYTVTYFAYGEMSNSYYCEKSFIAEGKSVDDEIVDDKSADKGNRGGCGGYLNDGGGFYRGFVAAVCLLAVVSSKRARKNIL